MKKATIVTYLLPALFMLVLASCNIMQSGSSGGSVSGTVSYNGSPVAAVSLDLESSSLSAIPGTSTTSGSNGKYSISLTSSDSSGTYFVGVSATGYNPDNWEINITNPSSSYSLDIALTKLITVTSPASGATGLGTSPTVTWNAGTDCATYEIEVEDASTNVIIATHSGINGTSYQLSNLTSGTQYTVMVDGYSSSGINVGLGSVTLTA